jgi:hypothetical protein
MSIRPTSQQEPGAPVNAQEKYVSQRWKKSIPNSIPFIPYYFNHDRLWIWPANRPGINSNTS